MCDIKKGLMLSDRKIEEGSSTGRHLEGESALKSIGIAEKAIVSKFQGVTPTETFVKPRQPRLSHNVSP